MKQKTILAKIVSWVSVWILLFSNIFCVIPETVRASNVFSTYNDAYAETGGWLDFGAFTVTETEILQDSTGTGSNASTFHADATYYTKVHEIGLEAALSGWAWSDDIGWIQMSVNTLSDNTQTGATITASASQSASNYGVYIDANGYFRGYAWSETAGWVSFYDGISSTSYTATTWRAFYTVTLLSPAEDARIDTNSLVLSFDLDDFEGDALKFQIQVGTDAEVST